MAIQPARKWQSRILTQAVWFGPDSAPDLYIHITSHTYDSESQHVCEQWSGLGLTKWSSSDGRKEVLSGISSFNNQMFSV